MTTAATPVDVGLPARRAALRGALRFVVVLVVVVVVVCAQLSLLVFRRILNL